MFRSILSNWVGLFVAGVTSVILTPILIHELGGFYYGMWILASSILDYYGFLDQGMRAAFFRFVAWSKGAQDRVTTHQVFISTLAATVVIGICLIGLTFLLVAVLPDFFDLLGSERRTFRWLVLLLGLSMAVTISARVLGTYLCALRRFDLYNLAAIINTILRAGLIIGALRWGFGVTGVAAVSLGIAIFSLFLHWGLVRRIDRQVTLDWRRFSWTRIRQLASYGFHIFIYTMGDYLRSYSDPVVIARILGTALVTPFSIAVRLMEYFKLVLAGVGGPLMGRMSELEGQSKQQELQQLFLRSTRITALLSLSLGSLLVLNGEALIRLWVGEAFLPSYPLMLILLAGYLVALAQHPSVVVILARARHRPLALWTVGEAVVNLLLSIYWARQFGLIGVALGTCIPMLVVNILILPWYVLRVVELSMWEYWRRALARPIAVAALFMVVCRLAPGMPVDGGALYFLWTVGWQTTLFGVLTYLLGLGSAEREFVKERGRQFVMAVRLVRES